MKGYVRLINTTIQNKIKSVGIGKFLKFNINEIVYSYHSRGKCSRMAHGTQNDTRIKNYIYLMCLGPSLYDKCFIPLSHFSLALLENFWFCMSKLGMFKLLLKIFVISEKRKLLWKVEKDKCQLTEKYKTIDRNRKPQICNQLVRFYWGKNHPWVWKPLGGRGWFIAGLTGWRWKQAIRF